MENGAEPTPAARRIVFLLLFAWLLPGSGHWSLGRKARGVWFAAIVLICLVVGASLEGNLHHPVAGQPLSYLATAGALGSGAGYLALRYVLLHVGDPTAAGYEYGTAFLLTAGLMNLLLVLDAWDIARGRKE